MNLLIVGSGKGSWTVRGKQLGAELGARVTAWPTEADWHWAGRCVLVKRALLEHGSAAMQHRVPIIWDAVDFWQQPEANTFTREQAIRLARLWMEPYRIALVIGATQEMADDLGGLYLSHHSRPGLSPMPVRETAEVVAYEGTRKYLGSWHKALESTCARLGLRLVVNPPDLREADIVVAFRGEQWDGPICRRWKSGVKYVNALAAGRPVITQPSAAFNEIRPFGTAIEDVRELEAALTVYQSQAVRQAVADECATRATPYLLPHVARQYRAILQTAVRRAA